MTLAMAATSSLIRFVLLLCDEKSPYTYPDVAFLGVFISSHLAALYIKTPRAVLLSGS